MAKQHKAREDQQHLPGVAEKHPVIHPLAKQYAKLRDKRMEAGRIEKEAKTKLIETMKEEGMDTYSYQDVDVVVSHQDSLKVTIGGKDVKDEAEE